MCSTTIQITKTTIGKKFVKEFLCAAFHFTQTSPPPGNVAPWQPKPGEKMEHFDVAIIGLGPAGAALARQLAGRMRVIAPDKKREQGTEGFTKPCGGLLASDAQRSLIPSAERSGMVRPECCGAQCRRQWHLSLTGQPRCRF